MFRKTNIPTRYFPTQFGGSFSNQKIIFFPQSFNNNITLNMASKKIHKTLDNISSSSFPGSIKILSNGIQLTILAKPGAKQSKITNIGEDSIGVQISAPPKEGQANEELIDFISQVLGIKKRNVVLSKGAKDRNKVLLITEISANELWQKLNQNIDVD